MIIEKELFAAIGERGNEIADAFRFYYLDVNIKRRCAVCILRVRRLRGGDPDAHFRVLLHYGGDRRYFILVSAAFIRHNFPFLEICADRFHAELAQKLKNIAHIADLQNAVGVEALNAVGAV